MEQNSPTQHDLARLMTAQLWGALGGMPDLNGSVTMSGEGALPSAFAVSDFAAAAQATAGLSLAEWIEFHTGIAPMVDVDRRLASLWFGFSIAPNGWELPPVWDPIAGDYRTMDGWIRLHTNAPHHRRAALSVLGTGPDHQAVAAVVAAWRADELEAAIVAAGGCAAAMRSLDAWSKHPQGRAVLAEPLMRMVPGGGAMKRELYFNPARPLSGVRVLDLTRVLAGPVATRFLAGFGADVLRIDPPEWDEGAVVPEVTLGKRCARLDLRTRDGLEQIRALLADADVLVHGYRPGALEALGLGAEAQMRIRPGLIDVSLDAYGWSGPWKNRRGFDSLVQMSSGIAASGMRLNGADRPIPLPVQALDHGAGYLLATAAVRGLTLRQRSGVGSWWQTSLARVAGFLGTFPQDPVAKGIGKPTPADYADELEETGWGPARRLRPAVRLDGAGSVWDRPAGALGTAAAAW